MKYKSQFYLVENPTREPDNSTWPDEYIYHAKKPRFMATIKVMQSDLHTIIMEDSELSTVFTYINDNGIIEIFQLLIIEQFDEAAPEQYYSKLKRMADWYCNYLKWEEAQQDELGEIHHLTDYNEKTPGLKILYNNTRWVVIYHGIVKSFDNESAMDEFVINKLLISEAALTEGYINQL